MPRAARIQSSTGVYHVILRGVNKQQIFECKEDYECFEDILSKMSRVHKNYYGEEECAHIYTYAYCLMGNHVHILCKEADEPIGEAIKRITSSYVYYYNRKYQRVGHLFQERFKSQTVDDWGYFLTLMRYIHQNPLKPKLVTKLEDYPWSSWRGYVGKANDCFCCTDVVFRRVTIEELTQLIERPMTETEEKGLLDVEEKVEKKFFTDSDVWEILTSLCGATTLSEFQAMERPRQKHYLWEAHEMGVGPRVLSRLTGVPYSIVQRATSAENERIGGMDMVCEPSPDDGEFEKTPEW